MTPIAAFRLKLALAVTAGFAAAGGVAVLQPHLVRQTPTPAGVEASAPEPAASPTAESPHPKSTTTEPESGSGPFACVDGTTSHAKHRQGACSHHGGVA